jgi:hypothetical protein
MDAGFKRHVKYITLLQLKYTGMIATFACAYCLFLGFMDTKDVSSSVVSYFEMLLFIAPMSLHMGYVKGTAGFCCSMGCMRKHLITGQNILSLEILSESVIAITIVRLIFHQQWQNGGYNLFYFVMGDIVMMALGIFGALAIDKWKTGGVILFCVEACAFGMMYGFLFRSTLTIDGNEVKTNPIVLLVTALTALVLYGIAVLLSAKKFKKLEVVV